MKRRKNKSHILFGSFLIILGIVLPLSKELYNYTHDKKEESKVEYFFDNHKDDIDKQDTEQKNTKQETTYNYIAVLEIPTINLKRGLVDKTNKNNNVNRNITILKESDMPDVENGNFILAGHSGTSRVAFFRYLNKVKENDLIFIYYKNIKYTYKVVHTHLEVRDGDIDIVRNKNKTSLTLTTCSQEKKGNQIVIISELINKENY